MSDERKIIDLDRLSRFKDDMDQEIAGQTPAISGNKLTIGSSPTPIAQDIVNVNDINGVPTTAYASADAARAAVDASSGLRIQGQIITYLLADGWYTDQFIGSDVSGWTTASNWKVLGPVSVSQNTLSIGGNYAGEMSTTYDVTLHSGQTFASLSALLSDANLNTLIPLVVRKGGMNIKFVQTSDNKYVQYRLITDEWSTTVTDWEKQGADFQNNIGYYVCETASSSQVKSINAPLYKLIIGSSIKIKFLHHSETAIAYFNINSTGTTEIYYNGKSVGWGNSWKDNEIVEMYYDGNVYQCWSIIQNEIFDISAFNNGTTYVNLEKALAAIPSYLVYDIKIVKFIQEFATGNQYVQYTLNNPSGFTRDYTKWQSNRINIIKRTDLFNPGTVKPDGTIGISGDTYYYAKAPINGGSRVFAFVKSSPTLCSISFRDSNNALISNAYILGAYGDPQKIFMTAPENAAWVYICNNMTDNPDGYYIIDFLDNEIANGNAHAVTSDAVYKSIQDYTQKKNDFVNEGVVKDTGNITDGAGVYYYAKRAVKNGDRIFARVNTSGTVCAIAFFDNNNTIISSSTIKGTYYYQEINTIAPPNAAFVLISSRKPHIENSYYIINDVDGNEGAMSFSQRCFNFGIKAPKKPCLTITFDVLKDFSFGSQKGLFDYINLLRNYGVYSSSFFIRPTDGQIDSVADFVKVYEMGQDICIHSIHTDSFGENDTENPHPSLADAETKLQNYQKWFKNCGFPYSMGWVTSRGALYSPYLPLLEKYLSYGHTSNNLSYDGSWSDADGINQRTDDKMDIIRVGLDLDSSATSTDEQNLVSRIETLIDETIASNGFLCLYGHGFDNMSAPYTMRESVLTGILTYLKTKIDNFEILAGSEADIVPYFYD